jgi:hypothetical protein
MTAEEGASCDSEGENDDEVTKVLSMYRNIKSELDNENNLDYLAAVLAAGMLLDMKGEDEKPMNLSTLIRAIKSRVMKLTDGKVTKNDLSMAKLVSSYIALSPKLESPDEIINMWDKLRKEVVLTDDLDFVIALMISGRCHGLETPEKLEEVESILKKLMA